MRLLEPLAKFCAVLAGLMMTVITLMTCISLIGRNTTGWTIAGDFEISGFVAGAAVALLDEFDVRFWSFDFGGRRARPCRHEPDAGRVGRRPARLARPARTQGLHGLHGLTACTADGPLKLTPTLDGLCARLPSTPY